MSFGDVAAVRFRAGDDVAVLGLRHAGKASGNAFREQRIAVGDTLLVTGPWETIQRLSSGGGDYVVLDLPTEAREAAPAANRAPYAILSALVNVMASH